MAQGGAAAILSGLLSPLAAILPFVEPGLAEDANCAALIAEGKAGARRRAAGPPDARTRRRNDRKTSGAPDTRACVPPDDLPNPFRIRDFRRCVEQ